MTTPFSDASHPPEGTGRGLYPVSSKKITHLSVRQIMEGEGVALGEEHDGSFHTYMAHKIAKLQNCNLIDDENIMGDIFRGCYVYINGSTEPPVEELRRLLIRYGGACDNYRTSRITHFACNNFTDAQLKNIREKVKIKEKQFYVTTAWILDSISKQKKLSEADYSPIGLKDRHGSNIVRMFGSKEGAAQPTNSATDKYLKSSFYDGSIDDIDINDDPLKVGNKSILKTGPAASEKSNGCNVSRDSIAYSVDQTDKINEEKDSEENQPPQQTRFNSDKRQQHPRIASAENEPEIFLKQYFAQSRLHFIGSWRNRLPGMVNRLLKIAKLRSQILQDARKISNATEHGGHGASRSEGGYKGRSEGQLGMGRNNSDDENENENNDLHGADDMFGADCTKQSNTVLNNNSSGNAHKGVVNAVCSQRVVLHLDMDCFFVSAILRSDGMKHLRNQPVAVAHSADTPYTNTSVTSSSGVYTAGASNTSRHSSGHSNKAGEASNSRPLPSSSSISITATSADDISSVRQIKGNMSVPTPNFSSSSEISSCNYPARESGKITTIDSCP